MTKPDFIWERLPQTYALCYPNEKIKLVLSFSFWVVLNIGRSQPFSKEVALMRLHYLTWVTFRAAGLTENDFILAAKINGLNVHHLLRRKVGKWANSVNLWVLLILNNKWSVCKRCARYGGFIVCLIFGMMDVLECSILRSLVLTRSVLSPFPLILY